MVTHEICCIKIVSKPLQEVLNSLVTIVNYIKSSGANARLFKGLCRSMTPGSTVLFYTAACWVSKGNVVSRVFQMKNVLKQFLEIIDKREFMTQK